MNEGTLTHVSADFSPVDVPHLSGRLSRAEQRRRESRAENVSRAAFRRNSVPTSPAKSCDFSSAIVSVESSPREDARTHRPRRITGARSETGGDDLENRSLIRRYNNKTQSTCNLSPTRARRKPLAALQPAHRSPAQPKSSTHMIEFAAVIQQILVTPEATTMHLDISILDVSPLTALIDQEVAVSVRAASPAPLPTSHEKLKRT